MWKYLKRPKKMHKIYYKKNTKYKFYFHRILLIPLMDYLKLYFSWFSYRTLWNPFKHDFGLFLIKTLSLTLVILVQASKCSMYQHWEKKSSCSYTSTRRKQSEGPRSLRENRWVSVKRLLCYLCSTSNHGLLIHNNSTISLHAFSNANWASNKDGFTSTK